MIERNIIKQRKKEYRIQEFISDTLKNVGLSNVRLQRTPLGEKIVIHTSRPGLVVGRKGESIQRLSRELNEAFVLDNAQLEIEEVEQPNLDARIVAERIASNLERFGTRRFKAVMHRMLATIMESGALGVEILISGKVPSQRSRRWRVFAGYLKKSGYIAQNDVRRACAEARTRMGMVGIQVSIMPNIPLPYNVHVLDEPVTIIEEIEDENGAVEQKVETKPAPKKPKKPAKKAESKPKAETKPDVKAETKTSGDEDTQASVGGADQGDVKVDEADAQIAPEAETVPETAPEAETKPEAGSKSDTKADVPQEDASETAAEPSETEKKAKGGDE